MLSISTHGWGFTMRRINGVICFAVLFTGCDASPAPSPVTPKPQVPASQSAFLSPGFTLTGRVVWDGPSPSVPAVKLVRGQSGGRGTIVRRQAPNAPRIDPETGGIAGAVVSLRGVNLAAARPWDHPPVTIELDDERPMVRQGDGPPDTVGFVRQGDAVTLVSRQNRFHVLRARAAAFWSLAFPDPDRPRSRRLEHEGRVDLTSAAGCYWMHGYLFVSEHPYWTKTAADGRWKLPNVPPGEYEVVVWLPSWRVARVERDPESGAVARWTMAPGMEQARKTRMEPNGATIADFVFKE